MNSSSKGMNKPLKSLRETIVSWDVDQIEADDNKVTNRYSFFSLIPAHATSLLFFLPRSTVPTRPIGPSILGPQRSTTGSGAVGFWGAAQTQTAHSALREESTLDGTSPVEKRAPAPTQHCVLCCQDL
jgi:hypothetical protein